MIKRIALLTALGLCLGCDDDDTGPAPDAAALDVGVIDATLDAGPQDAEPDVAIVDAEPDATIIDAEPDATIVDAGPADAGLAACSNGLDDDDDGRVDYPADPGCEDPEDTDETTPALLACEDGADNDEDGRIDHPEDPGCASPSDVSEASACTDTLELRDVSALRRVEGTTVGAPAELNICRTNRAPEVAFQLTLRTSVANLHVDSHGTSFDTLLTVRRRCEDEESELACSDDAEIGVRTSQIDLADTPAGDYFILLDGFLDEQGPYVLNIHGELADGRPCDAEDEGPVRCQVGSVCIDGTCGQAACANDLDDDGDGHIDYPRDPGCDSESDHDETSPDPLPECSDGLDNDGDGMIDFGADQDCADGADNQEAADPACRNGRDDDGDGLVDLDDPGCEGDPERNSEWNNDLCRDGRDNDEDGHVDYPADPGCTHPRDASEDNPDPMPQCADGVDNDEDGLTDYPDDVDSCRAAGDDTEDDPCARREALEITGLRDVRGSTSDQPNDFAGTCTNISGNDSLLLWRVAEDRPLSALSLNTAGSRLDTVIYARSTCAAPLAEELGCDDNGAGSGDSVLHLGPQAAGDEVFIVVDSAYAGGENIWRMRVVAELAEGARCDGGEPWICGDGLACRERPEGGPTCGPAACGDGADNDGDGLIDFPEEPGCASASDDDETDPDLPPVCSNGVDDDEDGAIDFGDDPRCDSAADMFEGPDCGDDIDNDGDGLIDYDRDHNNNRDQNADGQCACPTDETEDIVEPQCSDHCDNDGDGLIDLEDPGCQDNPTRNSEFHVAQCRDGQDNDQDGLTDFPFDPGCYHEDDPIEENPDPLPACADGIDNDGDGFTDFTSDQPDDGCSAAGDDDEHGPCDAEMPIVPENGIIDGVLEGPNEHHANCGFSTSPDALLVAEIPYPAQVTANTFTTGYDTVLSARSACQENVVCPDPLPEDDICVEGPSERACNDDFNGTMQSQIEVDWPGGPLFLLMEGFSNSAGPFTMQVEAIYPLGGQCGPDSPAYARCVDGSVCAPADDASDPTCEAN